MQTESERIQSMSAWWREQAQMDAKRLTHQHNVGRDQWPRLVKMVEEKGQTVTAEAYKITVARVGQIMREYKKLKGVA